MSTIDDNELNRSYINSMNEINMEIKNKQEQIQIVESFIAESIKKKDEEIEDDKKSAEQSNRNVQYHEKKILQLEAFIIDEIKRLEKLATNNPDLADRLNIIKDLFDYPRSKYDQ